MDIEFVMAIEAYTHDLGDLFARQIIAEPRNEFERGKNEAFDLAASACYKAGTRQMIVWPEVTIKVSVPKDI